MRPRLQLVEEPGFDERGLACERNRRKALERLLEQDLQLEPGERRAQTEVAPPCTEGLVLGVASDVEVVGVLIAGLIAI